MPFGIDMNRFFLLPLVPVERRVGGESGPNGLTQFAGFSVPLLQPTLAQFAAFGVAGGQCAANSEVSARGTAGAAGAIEK